MKHEIVDESFKCERCDKVIIEIDHDDYSGCFTNIIDEGAVIYCSTCKIWNREIKTIDRWDIDELVKNNGMNNLVDRTIL